jgi:hypothetical protein
MVAEKARRPGGWGIFRRFRDILKTMKNEKPMVMFPRLLLALLMGAFAGLSGCGSGGAVNAAGAVERDLTLFLYHKPGSETGGAAFAAKQRLLNSAVAPGASAFYPAPYDFSGAEGKWLASGDLSCRILSESDAGDGVLELSVRVTNRAVRQAPGNKGRRYQITFPLADLGETSRQPCIYAVTQGALKAKSEGIPRGLIALLSIDYRGGSKRFEAVVQVYPE